MDSGLRQSVSVIIPVFNRAASIGEAIHSVLRQRCPADQIIVVDDGSTDNTYQELMNFRDDIRVLRQANAGAAAARNAGIAEAHTEWLAFLDSDDLWPADRLAIFHRDVEHATEGVLAHVGDIRLTGPGYDQSMFGERSVRLPNGFALQIHHPLQFAIAGISTIQSVVRRSALVELGGFDTQLQTSEDLAFFCKLALRGSFLMTGDVVAQGRRLQGDTISLTRLEREDPCLARRNFLRGYEALLDEPLTFQQQLLVQRAASGALLHLAEAEAGLSKAQARSRLLEAARRHPNPLVGWTKSLLPMLMGQLGYDFVLRQSHRRIDRSYTL